MSEDITGLAVELNTDNTPKEETVEVKTEEKPVETKPEETISELETLVEKSDDAIPLKKYMAEKNARRDAETKAKQLEVELTKLRETPSLSTEDIKVDVKALSEKHGIDEEVITDLLKASYTMTKDKVREEIEQEINPKLVELEQIKKDKAVNDFEAKFSSLLEKSLQDMPEYSSLVDKDDLKNWVKSGQYSKLSLPQLIEQKYSKFVQGKKTMETSHSAKTQELPEVGKMSDEDYINLDKNPELHKKWASSLEDRIRKFM